MSGLLAKGAALLAGSLLSLERQALTYRTVDGIELSLTAILTTDKTMLSDRLQGVSMLYTDTQVLVPADQFIQDGIILEPKEGDTFETVPVNSPGNYETFEVLPPRERERCWDWMDGAHHQTLVIHCKRSGLV